MSHSITIALTEKDLIELAKDNATLLGLSGCGDKWEYDDTIVGAPSVTSAETGSGLIVQVELNIKETTDV